MKPVLRQKLFACIIAITMVASGGNISSALAHAPDSSNTQPQIASEQDDPIQVPYAAVAEAEHLIAEGTIDSEMLKSLNEIDVNYEIVGPQPRILPAVAAIAVGAVSWCVKGALSSLPASGIQHLASKAHDGIAPPNWVMNAIFGCAGDPVVGALTSQFARVKFAGAVLAAVIKLRNFG